MAGPYTGTWRAQMTSEAEYTGALKWGTGINPIHSIQTGGPPLRALDSKLNIDPISTPGGDSTDAIVDDSIGLGYSYEDNPSSMFGYNVNDPELWGNNQETGTADRPSWGSDAPTLNREKTQNSTADSFPSWGGSRKSGPAGRMIRALRRGSEMIVAARVLPNEDVAQGWTNKTHGITADARTSDPSQYEMQTSMTQRYKVRAGSQNSGSQSDFSAPIESRVVGQKVKNYTSPDSSRHWDMLPYEQQDYMRPFLSRQAGTGYREWQYPNEMYVSPAIQREPSPDPELGPVAGTNYGYSSEDMGMYY